MQAIRRYTLSTTIDCERCISIAIAGRNRLCKLSVNIHCGLVYLGERAYRNSSLTVRHHSVCPSSRCYYCSSVLTLSRSLTNVGGRRQWISIYTITRHRYFVDFVASRKLPSGLTDRVYTTNNCLHIKRHLVDLRYTKLTEWSDSMRSTPSRQFLLSEGHTVRNVAPATSGNVEGLCCSERPASREGNVRQRAIVVGTFDHVFVHVVRP